ncbi:MAG: hypothetical protein ACRDK1_10535 [Solirubrobacterales bacterium]
MSAETCTWCDADVPPDDGFRLYGGEGERVAAFCRLEHVVPWVIRGAHPDLGGVDLPEGADTDRSACAHCGSEPGEMAVVLLRHRGDARVTDRFCSTDHLLEWAKAGGRWR